MTERHGPTGWRGAAVMVLLTLAVYVLRFASSWWLLDHGLGQRFDPHAFGTLGDAVLLSLAAPPLAGLLWWVLRRRGAWRGLFAPASRPGWTLLSILLLLVIGAPTPNQVWAMLLLPLVDAWPAVVSAACWFVTVALLRAVAVTGPRRSGP